MRVRLPPNLIDSQREHRLNMPVDLTPGGPPSQYPKRWPSRVWWVVIWALFCSIGAVIALLLWPTATPAHGARFWFCVAGAPNAAFLMVLGCARATYETAYLRALYRNQHRQNWRRARIAHAQKPLYVLAQAYYLPLNDGTLATTTISGKTVMTTQSPRNGAGHILHSRLPDIEPVTEFELDDESGSFGEGGSVNTTRPRTAAQAKPDGFHHVVTKVLTPLVDTLHTLRLLGRDYTPVVRLAITDATTAAARSEHVREALSLLGFPSIECEVVASEKGLMLVDDWLDAGEHKPLLVIAAEWYDAPPPSGSTEGGVALLFGMDALIGSLRAVGAIHRPVMTKPQIRGITIEELATAALWGQASPPEVRHAWISGLDSNYDQPLAAALQGASFLGLADSSAIHSPDRIIGHIGSGAAWLAVAAAIESGVEGPQLILSQTRTAQTAILYAHPSLKHENLAELE
jgi:hypothetical protein